MDYSIIIIGIVILIVIISLVMGLQNQFELFTRNNHTRNNEYYNNESLINTKSNVYKLTLYFAEWCGACKNFKPIWQDVKSLKRPDLVFEEKDISNKNINAAGIDRIPTIILEKPDGSLITYQDDHNKEKLNKFIITHMSK